MLGAVLLVTPLALAHVPHDSTLAVAAPLTLDPGVPWLLLAGSEDYEILERSDDGGRHWNMIGGAPLEDAIVGVAVLDDGTWVAASSRRVWWSTDEGATWEKRAAPSGITFVAGGAVLTVAGADGAWSGPPGGVMTRGAPGSAVLFGSSEDGDALVDDAGQLWLGEGDGRWLHHGSVPGGTSAVTRIGPVAYAGAEDGSLRVQGAGTWGVCGALPPEALGAHPAVVGLASSPVTADDPAGLLIVVTGDGGPYRSRDGCATWEDLHGPLDTVYSGEGSASSVAEAARALIVSGPAWLHAGWAGLAIGDDADSVQPTLIPCDYTRGVAFSPDFTNDHTVLLGGYAAGVLRSTDGGATWFGAGNGLDAANVQQVAFPAGERNARDPVAIVGHHGWASRDGGTTWTKLDTPQKTLSQLFGADVTQPRTWAFGPVGGTYEAAVSTDGARSFSLDAPMNTALNGATPAGIVHVQTPEGGAQVLLGAPTVVEYSFDDGLTWSQRYADPTADQVSGPAGWPQTAPTRVLFSDTAGVHYSDDGNSFSTNDDFGGQQIRALEVAGDEVYVASRGGELWRSDDGGTTFTDLHLRTDAPVHILRAAPGFDTSNLLIIGTHDGTWTLGDATGEAPTLDRWSPYERVDDASPYFGCVACDDIVDDNAAGMGQLRPLGHDGVATTTLRGDHIDIIGTDDAGGSAELWVDGNHVLDINDAVGVRTNPQVLTTVDGLKDGWHDIEVRGVQSGVAIDAFASSSGGVRSGDRGCATANATGWMATIAGFWLVLRRARLRAPRP